LGVIDNRKEKSTPKRAFRKTETIRNPYIALRMGYQQMPFALKSPP